MSAEPLIATSKSDRLLFAAVTLLYWTSLYAYVPILSPFLEAKGLAYSVIGIVLGSYGLTQLIIRLPLGVLSDKLRLRKPFILFGMLTAALSCLLFMLPGSWLFPLLARTLSGLSASTWVAFTVLYASYYPAAEVTRAMSGISLLTVAGQLTGMGLSGWLAEGWGWNAAFAAGLAAGAVGLAAAVLIKEPKGGVAREPIRFGQLAAVLRSPLLIRISLLSILAHIVLFVTMFGFTPSRATELGAGTAQLSMLSFAFMIPHAFASYYTGKTFAPRFGHWRVLLAGFALSALCTAAIAFVPSFFWLAVTQAVNGFAQGLHLPLLLGLSIRGVEPGKQATAMGFYQAVYSAGMFSGPFLAGWLNQAAGLAGGFYFGAAAAVLAAGLTWLWSRSPKSASREQPAAQSPNG